MTNLYELEIVSAKNGERRVVRVRASTEDQAWSKVPVTAEDVVTLKRLDEELTVEIDQAPAKDYANSTVAAPQPRSISETVTRQRNQRVSRTPSASNYLGELFIGSFTSNAISEEALRKSGVRPSLIMPTSLIARRGLVAFYLAAAIASYSLGGADGRDFDHEAAAISAAISVASWMGIVTIIRYTFFVYPWERSRRLKTQK